MSQKKKSILKKWASQLYWYDVGAVMALILTFTLAWKVHSLSDYQILVTGSLIALLLHQLEKFRIVGTYPGMLNEKIYGSLHPDRFPLNGRSAFLINVFVGWVPYVLAIILGDRAIWLGIATITVSATLSFTHVVLFNIKAKSFFNAGMATSILLLLPIVLLFFWLIEAENIATSQDYYLGLLLGFVLNYFGRIKMITWLKKIDSPYPFPSRNMLKPKIDKFY